MSAVTRFRARPWRTAAGLCGIAGGAGFLLLVPPLPQDPAYHAFADQGSLWAVPHAANVLSNLPFPLVGLAGLAWIFRTVPRAPGTADARGERGLYGCFFAALTLTGIGSAYYHWAPDTPRLFWDRLPLAWVFTSLSAVLLAERIAPRLGRRAAPWLLAAGTGAVVYWAAGEARGAGDLRPYFLLQALPLVGAPVLTLLYRPRYTRGGGLLAALALYLLAIACDRGDGVVARWSGGLVGGHPLKHMLAAGAAAWVLRMLILRQALPQSPAAGGFPPSGRPSGEPC